MNFLHSTIQSIIIESYSVAGLFLSQDTKMQMLQLMLPEYEKLECENGAGNLVAYFSSTEE